MKLMYGPVEQIDGRKYVRLYEPEASYERRCREHDARVVSYCPIVGKDLGWSERLRCLAGHWCGKWGIHDSDTGRLIGFADYSAGGVTCLTQEDLRWSIQSSRDELVRLRRSRCRNCRGRRCSGCIDEMNFEASRIRLLLEIAKGAA